MSMKATYEIRKMVVREPSISPAEISVKLGDMGLSASDATIYQAKSQTLITMDVMKREGWRKL